MYSFYYSDWSSFSALPNCQIKRIKQGDAVLRPHLPSLLKHNVDVMHSVFHSHCTRENRTHHTSGKMLIQSSVSWGEIAHQSRSDPLKRRVRVNRQANAWIITASAPEALAVMTVRFQQMTLCAVIQHGRSAIAGGGKKKSIQPTYMMNISTALTAAIQGDCN